MGSDVFSTNSFAFVVLMLFWAFLQLQLVAYARHVVACIVRV